MNEAEVAAGLAPTPGYRYAEVVGDQLFVAGQVPLDSEGTVVWVDDATGQASVCLANLRTLIELYDFDVADVRHVTIHVVGEHRNLLDAWSAVVEWFGGSVPPATLLGAHRLGFADQLVEIDATIVRSPTS